MGICTLIATVLQRMMAVVFIWILQVIWGFAHATSWKREIVCLLPFLSHCFVARWLRGSVQWESGKMHGKGERWHWNGAHYIGDYQSNERHGRGVYTSSNLETYDGEVRWAWVVKSTTATNASSLQKPHISLLPISSSLFNEVTSQWHF